MMKIYVQTLFNCMTKAERHRTPRLDWLNVGHESYSLWPSRRSSAELLATRWPMCTLLDYMDIRPSTTTVLKRIST